MTAIKSECHRRLMMRGARFFCGLALGLGIAGCGSMMVVPAPPPDLASSVPAAEKQAYLVSHIDGILDREQRVDRPGVAIMVVKDGEVIYSRGKGVADINRGAAITDGTAFELGSLTKSITAIAVMQLKERGLLSLSDSVLKWLPELPSTWGRITVHHLLSHQSGVPEYANEIRVETVGTLDGLTNQSLIRRFAAGGVLNFAPGTKGEYSNGNYVLLAEMISRVSGKTYAQYIRENVFTPLGMRSSFVLGEQPPDGAPVALNFARTATVYGVTFATVGPIGIFSTTADLNILVRATLAGKLVSHESLSAMTMPESAHPVGGDEDFYGYGWFVAPEGLPLTVFAHAGGADGYRNYMRVNNTKGVYSIFLSNGGNSTLKVLEDALAVVKSLYE